MKPRRIYWSNELLDYFVGTVDWHTRTEIQSWLRDSPFKLLPHWNICRIHNQPFENYSMPASVEGFINKCLGEFGQFDYEIAPLKPCGGWKFLDIII